MKDIPDKSIDCVVTSPPYNMRLRIRNGQYTTREKSEHFSKKYTHFADDLPINDYFDFHKRCIAEMLRVAPLVFINIQIVTGSKEAWFKLIGEYAEYIKDIIIWDKGYGQPAMHPAVINRASELILVLENPKTAGRAFAKSYFERGTMSDIWRIGRGGKGQNAGHGAVFSEELVSTILNGWTKQGDTILDPFNGTGTVSKTAKMLNRHFIGIEISPEYCDIANERLKQEILL
jgi:site-specific DNA-methyltransferase (adenine-specific)/modification methylase